MIRVGSETIIRCGLPEVFAFVTDAENDRFWVKFARRAVKLTPGPVGRGTRFRQSGEFMGVRVSTDWEITEFEPCRRMVGEGRSGAVAFRGMYECGDAAGGTRLCKSGTIQFRGMLAPAEPFLSVLFQNTLVGDLQRLKALLEQADQANRQAG